jgi:hypothetical protein
MIKIKPPAKASPRSTDISPAKVEQLKPFIFGLDDARRAKLEAVRVKEGLKSEAAALRLLMDEAFKARGVK